MILGSVFLKSLSVKCVALSVGGALVLSNGKPLAPG